MDKKFKIGRKSYTVVNYKIIFDELKKFYKYSLELDNTMPDYNSEVWQIAENIENIAKQIKTRAIGLEKQFNNN